MARFLCATLPAWNRRGILGILGGLTVAVGSAPASLLSQQEEGRGTSITVQARVLDRALVWDGPNGIATALGSLRDGDTSTHRWEAQLVTVQWEGVGVPRLARGQRPQEPDPMRRDLDRSSRLRMRQSPPWYRVSLPVAQPKMIPVIRSLRVVTGVLSVQYLRN